MSTRLESLVVALAIIAFIAKALDLFLGKDKRERLLKTISTFNSTFSGAKHKEVILFPLYLLAAFFSRVFGSRIISKVAFLRTTLLTSGILPLHQAARLAGLRSPLYRHIYCPVTREEAERYFQVKFDLNRIANLPRRAGRFA